MENLIKNLVLCFLALRDDVFVIRRVTREASVKRATILSVALREEIPQGLSRYATGSLIRF